MLSILTNIFSGLRAWRSTERILNEPRYQVGTILHEIRDSSGGPALMKKSVIRSMSLKAYNAGRVEVQSLTGGGVLGDRVMVFSAREFDALHPVIALVPPKAKR